jgi:tetratricopeptide (TPR) repeat protein
MRIIVREDPAKPGLATRLSGKRSLSYKPDLSDTALEGALENEVNDNRAPLDQRMQSLTVLAGMDSSHRRTEQALEKYELLASYYEGLGNLPGLALAWNGMGEACAIAQRTDDARAHFERALAPALDAKDVPTLSNITFNLARLHQSQRAWPIAVEYYEGLSTLARAALNAPLQLICHEQRGACLRELGQFDAALDEWRAGAKLGEGIGMSDQQLSCLRRSAELLESRGRTSELRELNTQIAELRRAGAQELPL